MSTSTSRKRSSTISVQPLHYGQHRSNVSVWLHESSFHPGDVIINLSAWPGLARGDLIQITPAGCSVQPGQGFMFLVDESSTNNSKTMIQSVSVLRDVANKFCISQTQGVTLTKIDPTSVTANVIEVFFRDMYMGRRDMWRLSKHMTGKPVFAGQKTAFFACLGATIRNVYIDGKAAACAFVAPTTRTVMRSLSARSTIFISVCRELWDFADDGERYYEKIVHSFFPALIKKWRQAGAKHLVAIVLFSRVFYDQSELEYAAGPLRQDDDGNWYKDFYKVVVDLEIIRDWKPALVTLKESFFAFQRDILFNHHYHQNQRLPNLSGGAVDTLRRLVGHLSYAHEAPILEAINLGLNPTDLHYIDRSLSLTGNSTIVITPGTGHFRVPKTLLRFTTTRLLDQGFGVDLVCLTKSPLHRSPLFSFKGVDPELAMHDVQHQSYSSRETDPLWTFDPAGWHGELKLFHWEPFWLIVSFWDVQADQPFRQDRFVPRARMPEIQMLGLLDHDVSSTIEIPYSEDPGASVEAQGKMTLSEARKIARDQFDHDIFAKHEHTPQQEISPPSRFQSNGNGNEYDNLSHLLPAPMPVQSLISSRVPFDRTRSRHTRIPSQSIIAEEPGSEDAGGTSPKRLPAEVRKTRSSSRDSTRSASSNLSHTSSARRKSVSTAKFGSPAWLLTPFRSGLSQPQASQIFAKKDDTKATRRAADGEGSASASLVDVREHSETKARPSRASSTLHSDPIAIRPPASNITSTSYSRSPVFSPREDALVSGGGRRLSRTPNHPPMNPSRLSGTFPRSQSVLARRWQHVFAGPTFTHDVKWTSMCAPACLPLTTEHYPDKAEIDRFYVNHSYDVFLGREATSSILLRKDASKAQQDWPLLIMREMVAARLIQGFQLIIKSSQPPPDAVKDINSRENTPRETKIATEPDDALFSYSSLPQGVADVLPDTTHSVYLSLANHVHRLTYEPVEDLIRVNRFVRRADDRVVRMMDYECLVWPKLGEGYTEAKTTFSLPDLDAYGWNRLDLTITGYQRDFGDLIRHWRTRYLVIPSESPPDDMYAQSGEKLSDEECRLLGTDRLAELFGKARWLAPGESADQFVTPRFLPTWLDPPASVMDENLMATLDEFNTIATLGKPRTSDRVLEGMSLISIAKAMRDEPSLIKDQHWHRKLYPNSFTGYELVSWLVSCFRDVSTRDQAVEWGVRLQTMGLIDHVRKEHGFMDGHYYYVLIGEYAAPTPRSPVQWFRAPKPAKEEPPSPSDTYPKKPGKRHTLSQTMIIDADPSKRSDQAESIILHHDIIQNPGTAFHFELHWVGTAGRCIDDLLQHWSRGINRYGLKLVEGYIDPILDISTKNIFQSCFPILLALPPPSIPDIRSRLAEGSSTAWYFEYAILRRFGYILDIEAEQSYSNSVDVYYSYRRASFKQSQFIHQSGLAFVQVMGGTEGFRWVTNRLLATSTPFPTRGRDAHAPDEPTPHEKADAIRLALHAFCSSAEQLSKFYEEIKASLPPIIEADDGVVFEI